MHTVIIIDASVSDQHALIAGLPDDAEILLLNAEDVSGHPYGANPGAPLKEPPHGHP